MEADSAAVTDTSSRSQRPLRQRALAAALDLNLISPAEVAEGAARVAAVPGCERLARLSCAERSWIVKCAGGSTRAGHDWRAELALYRVGLRTPEATIMPNLVTYSEDHAVLILEELARPWRRLDTFELRSPWSVEICSRVAASLARWHQASQALLGIRPTMPGLLSAVRADTAARTDPLILRVLGDDSLRSAVRDVDELWGTSHVMHGDVRLRNFLCHPDGSTRLIEWTASGWGDPRWDLAGLLRELRSAELDHGIDTAAHRSAALNAYAERAQSPSELSESDPALRAFVAAQLVTRALELQRSPGHALDRVDVHLAAARNLVSG